MTMKLDLGAGARSPEGFLPLGNVNGTQIYPLPYADGSVDEIRASHVLEHFPHAQVPDVLKEWVRALKPGGLLRIAVPDFGKIAERYLAGEPMPTEGYVMGGQVDSADYHKSLFDADHLKKLLAEAGLVLLRPWKSELADDCAALPISLNLGGTKPQQGQPKVRAVMTAPRLGFNDMWDCAMLALPKLGIDFARINGAFWDQCITRAIEETIEAHAPDYVLAIDYDSVFHAGHVAKLLQLAMAHPEADAIAPLQASRHKGAPLFGVDPNDGDEGDNSSVRHIERVEFCVDLRRAPQAHFGLTLLRVEALKSLSKPWFYGRPNGDGEWKDGKTDPDIAFWRKWKAEGFSLYLAPRVVIGHLELMVRWPDEDMQAVWQSVRDWDATRRAPAGSWTGEV
jgi:SAM-dependent methyltransferase